MAGRTAAVMRAIETGPWPAPGRSRNHLQRALDAGSAPILLIIDGVPRPAEHAAAG